MSDKYVEIQKVFSDVYCSKGVRPLIDKGTGKSLKTRLAIVLFATILFAVCLVFLILNLMDDYSIKKAIPFIDSPYVIIYSIFGMCLIGILLTTYANIFSKYDNDLKQAVIKTAHELLKPNLELNWCKLNYETGKILARVGNIDISGETFYNILRQHDILRINASMFKIDDIFMGKFNNISYEMYELTNKFRFFCPADLMISVGFVLMAVVCALLPWACFIMYGQQSSKEYEPWFYWAAAVVYIVSFLIIMALIYLFATAIKESTSIAGFLDKFKGLILKFRCNKTASGRTIVIENHEENLFMKIFQNNNYEKVELEDIEFNKKFSVYSTDQVEARYMLTSAMMERLLNLKQTFKSKYIRASFVGDELVLAIQSDKDLFRLAGFWTETNSKVYQTMFLELISILKITDALNLQSNTGL